MASLPAGDADVRGREPEVGPPCTAAQPFTINAQGSGERMAQNRTSAWSALLALAVLVGPGAVQAQGAAGKPVIIADGDCEATCAAAPAGVYQCLAREMTHDIAKHSQFYGAVSRLKARPTPDAVERFFSSVRRTSCSADQYRISVDGLNAILFQNPFLGREFDLKGTLVRDTNTNRLRVQSPEYTLQWAVDESSIDPAWIGQQVAFRAVTIGAGAVRATVARKTRDADEVYIQCLATGFSDRKLYLSETFLGSKSAIRTTEAEYAAFLRGRYRGNFTPATEARCEYNVFAERAAELHAFTSRNNATRLVLTGWKGG
ncbi:MAG: hypothetical protein AB1942_23930 [Pseudomonadota bacterium]